MKLFKLDWKVVMDEGVSYRDITETATMVERLLLSLMSGFGMMLAIFVPALVVLGIPTFLIAWAIQGFPPIDGWGLLGGLGTMLEIISGFGLMMSMVFFIFPSMYLPDSF